MKIWTPQGIPSSSHPLFFSGPLGSSCLALAGKSNPLPIHAPCCPLVAICQEAGLLPKWLVSSVLVQVFLLVPPEPTALAPFFFFNGSLVMSIPSLYLIGDCPTSLSNAPDPLS